MTDDDQWYYTATCVLLAYDYCLTLNQEIEEIWKRKKTGGMLLSISYVRLRIHTILYCRSINSRCLSFFPGALKFLDSFEYSCNRFAIVEWIQTLLIVLPAEAVLVYRMYALTNRSIPIVLLLSCVMISQCSIVIYALSRPGTNNALFIPDYKLVPFHMCILYSDPTMDTAYLSLSIFFDLTVFSLTMIRTFNQHYLLPRTVLHWTIQRDGALYFCAILSGNIVWMVLSLCGRPGLKFMNAQYVNLELFLVICFKNNTDSIGQVWCKC
ncbi:hypothetical protein BDQ12DRAFT_599337 [Crucibulum laeve]|uniref:DUF6533 domain-containing protein n=1 Tax=Crucibulum laeve TaxID=68775 RepID=A0A5C3MD03_9AGAR|nr:hypothetical protein BDQ12DRAFT_599337 [Crucibulum laeve]